MNLIAVINDLQAEVKRLREALERIADNPCSDTEPCACCFDDAKVARAALTEEKK